MEIQTLKEPPLTSYARPLDYLIDPATGGACVTLSGFFRDDLDNAFEVAGTIVGYGSEGEPCLTNCEIVRRVRLKGGK